MDKYKCKEEVELQKVDSHFSVRNEFNLTDYGGYFRNHLFCGNASRFLSSSLVEPVFNNDPSVYSTQRNELYKSLRKFKRCIEICIYFPNKIGVTFELEDGPIATADELLHMAAPEVGLPLEALNVFSLWFSSPYLEIQLKPHHLPYKICHQWADLLKKYTHWNKDILKIDEPVLSCRRNVFYSKDEEMKIKNSLIMSYLYDEAKNNILDGHYPCSDSNYCMLAAWQAYIELGSYDPEIHTLEFWRTKLNKFLPRHLRRSKWSILRLGFIGKNSIEAKILESYCNISSELHTEQLQKKYLEFCWTLPFYGAAFFHGQIEPPPNKLSIIFRAGDKPVLVAINRQGVTLIDQEENIVLLGLKYEELCWEFRPPTDSENPECFPCLFLQFVVTVDNKKTLKLLQIFSKQAVMMDALISVFVDELKSGWNKCDRNHLLKQEIEDNALYSNSLDVDEIDINDSIKVIYSEALEPAIQSNSNEASSESTKISNQLHRLSLATFNEEGECIEQVGSWPVSR